MYQYYEQTIRWFYKGEQFIAKTVHYISNSPVSPTETEETWNGLELMYSTPDWCPFDLYKTKRGRICETPYFRIKEWKCPNPPISYITEEAKVVPCTLKDLFDCNANRAIEYIKERMA